MGGEPEICATQDAETKPRASHFSPLTSYFSLSLHLPPLAGHPAGACQISRGSFPLNSMKKVLPIVVLLLAVGAAAFIHLQRQQAASRIRATALAPADTLLFVHLPDVRQTAIRWPRTALAQIGKEPEIQAFLERPRAKLPWFSDLEGGIEKLAQIAPREAYIAVTSLDGQIPRFVAGFSFSGSRAALDELLKEPRASLRRAWPAGKADIVLYAGAEIETYTDKDNTIAETVRDGWYMVSNNLELLQSSLDRLDAKPGAPAAIASAPAYQQALAPHPGDAEAVIYARLDTLADKLTSLLASTGQKPDPKQLEELRKTQAVSAAFKFDGSQIRDTVFVLNPSAPRHQPLARRGLDLSTAETLLYYTFRLSEEVNMPAQSTAPLALLVPGLSSMENALAAKGLKFSDFGKIFGPELSILLDWPVTDLQPVLLLGLDVRDSKRAGEFLDALSTGQPHSGWNRRQLGDAVLYAAPAQGIFPAPLIALIDNFLIIGLNEPNISTGIQRLRDKEAPLGKTPEFQAASRVVSAPTEAFGYLDTKRMFERGYGILRPFLAMSLAFNPDGGRYIDAGKLPGTDAVSRHLTPSIYSQTSLENGTLIESAGTLTFNQALLGVFAGAGAAALPTLKQALPNASGVPGGGVQPGSPQPAAPVKPTLPAPEPKPDAERRPLEQATLGETPAEITGR